MIPENLLAAYKSTNYVVEISPDETIAIRVGEPSKEADKLCQKFGHSSWAFVTPYNPRSQQLSPEKNAAKMKELVTVVESRKLAYLPGEGIGCDPSWTPERSVFIVGATEEFAIALGLKFEQYAVVCGRFEEVTRLVEVPLK